MLTRLEVDGFKNLRNVAVEFGPYTCVAGLNGVGKSNLFDAIEFLSLLSEHPLMTAAMRLRDSGSGRSSDPLDLFWTDGSVLADRIRLAVEMIVPGSVEDEFGREARPSITFLRYEVEIGHTPSGALSSGTQLVLRHESLEKINQQDARLHMRFPQKSAFRKGVVRGRRAGGAFISTEEVKGALVTRVHGDGGSRGQGRPSATERAPMTIVGTTTQASDPTVLAVKREFQSWKMLALEPSAMRTPSRFRDPDVLSSAGGNLASTLFRLAQDDTDAYAQVARRLADLLPVDKLWVERHDALETLTLKMQQRGGAGIPAKGLSDGTLRFLALCVLDADPKATGLICMEEPENGIHPGRMEAMVDLVTGMAVDADDAPGPNNPFRQVIVNTHSPTFLHLQDRDDLLFAQSRARRIDDEVTRSVTFAPHEGTWRCTNAEPGVPRSQMLSMLRTALGGDLAPEFSP